MKYAGGGKRKLLVNGEVQPRVQQNQFCPFLFEGGNTHP